MTIPDSSGYHYMTENGSIELPCKPEEERRIVQELTAKAEANLREGMMSSEIETVEQRLKSFMGQLQTECGILERLVYKHKNQHRRCSYFQYILKVRRDLKLLKLVNLEEIWDASFMVINGNRPKQKVQLLESLKRRRCDGGKYNFLERLLGATRLLSQMVEPMLKAAAELSTLLAQSFFMKFALTTLAVLARIRVLVQQILLDAVHLYNTISSLSQKEQTIKLNQEGFEVFREYYPKKEEATVTLECIWQTDMFVLVERTDKSEIKSQEKDDQEEVLLKASEIQYENIKVLLGADESATIDPEHVSADPINGGQNGCDFRVSNDEKQARDSSDSAASIATIISQEDSFTNVTVRMTAETYTKELVKDGLCIVEPSLRAEVPTSSISPLSSLAKLKNETKKKVAFVSVKPAVSFTSSQSKFHMKRTEGSGGETEDSFFNLLTSGNQRNSFF